MPTVRKAMRGDRGAIRTLYEREKGRAYTVAELLLGSEEDAEATVVQVFKGLWKEVLNGQIASDAAFAETVLRKTFVFAKTRIDRKDPAAFRIGANAVYDRAEYTLPHGEDLLAALPKALPVLARVFLALRPMQGAVLSDAELARLCGSTEKTVGEVFALEAEKLNRAFLACGSSLAAVGGLLDARAIAAPISPKTDEKALSTVDALIEPIEAARKKRTRTVVVSTVSIVLVALLIAAALILPPLMDKTYYAEIRIEGYDTPIVLRLDDETAPITVRNFVKLAESGFYDGLTFHRIIEGFMMQGGDPDANGTGGNVDASGKKVTIKGEFTSNGVKNHISHKRGVISMARGGDPNSASSQFFIVHQDSLHLDGDYAAFGYVVSGIEVVDDVCESAEPSDKNGTIPKAKQPVITSIIIRTE